MTQVRSGGIMQGAAPWVGADVHYYAYGSPGGEFPSGVPRAAKVTEIDTPGDPETAVGLCVINPTGLFFNQHVKHARAPGCWDWPTYGPPEEVARPADTLG